MGKNENALFFGGVPTEPDVKKLMEAYPAESLAPETIIPYIKVTEITGIAYNSSRWSSVTNQWRKRVEDDYGIMIGVIEETKGKAFIVFTESQKLDYCHKQTRGAVRKVKRAITVIPGINRNQLSEDEQKKKDHLSLVHGAMIAAAQMKQKKQLPEM